MFGLFKKKRIATPLGEATVHARICTLSLWRFRGTMIEVHWKEGQPVPVNQVTAIRAEFDRFVELAMAELGVDEFPIELRTIVPESIDFLFNDADWSLCFRCAEWPDAWWTVDFKDGNAIGFRHGD